MKYSFYNDYSEGAHPKILQALQNTNTQQEPGYGEDKFCLEAVRIIKEEIKNPQAAVHFVSGGTQANLIVLSSILKPYESIIAAQTSHINVHESGAIEATGHKINTIKTENGKISAQQVEEIFLEHTDEHMVKPKAVFISQATELGTVYSLTELQDLRKTCDKYNLYLYMDGARLGTALVAKGYEMPLSEVSKLIDIFYIGGTKNGALFGEAIVINNRQLQQNFRHSLKQHGALLAKGRALGIQFQELFRENLLQELAMHANNMASKLSTSLEQMGIPFLAESPTNQIFPILPNSLIEKLKKDYGFYVWAKVDNENSAIRLVTSWATLEEKVDEFISTLSSSK